MTCSWPGASRRKVLTSYRPLVHKRYRLRRSVLITSNRVIADWGTYLGDTALATTILDRLMHRSVLAEFQGRSYRLKEAARRLAIDHETD